MTEADMLLLNPIKKELARTTDGRIAIKRTLLNEMVAEIEKARAFRTRIERTLTEH